MTHHCHARACKTPCRPELLMCSRHWAMVPRDIQAEVYRTYRRSQCDDKLPSREWHVAADRAILAVAVKEGRIGAEQAEAILKRKADWWKQFDEQAPAPAPPA